MLANLSPHPVMQVKPVQGKTYSRLSQQLLLLFLANLQSTLQMEQ
jgi:hypothetical protein